jgi:methanogenic corrinoid protein MtbC1
MSEKLEYLISDLKETEALKYVEEALEKGIDPWILLCAANEGMSNLCEKYSHGDSYITDLVFLREIMEEINERLSPYLNDREKVKSKGKVIIGTVGSVNYRMEKELIVFMLDSNGFEVIDLGIDIPADKFVDAIKESGSRVIVLNGDLPIAYQYMTDVIAAIDESGLRSRVKIIITGKEIDERVSAIINADAYGKDPLAVVKLAEKWRKE